uniref:Uncharacterized protein n=1 Tax=Cyprinus carpio TaxID=7962 RepID=A0A8C2KU89_CYPCA
MSSLFRSEEMCQAESVHSCISELGYLGLVQFFFVVFWLYLRCAILFIYHYLKSS